MVRGKILMMYWIGPYDVFYNFDFSNAIYKFEYGDCIDRSLGYLGSSLKVVEMTFHFDELIVSALLQDFSLVEHTNQISIGYRLDSMRNDQTCLPFHELIDIILYFLLSFPIKSRSSLIQDEYLRLSEQSSGNSCSLFLSA